MLLSSRPSPVPFPTCPNLTVPLAPAVLQYLKDDAFQRIGIAIRESVEIALSFGRIDDDEFFQHVMMSVRSNLSWHRKRVAGEWALDSYGPEEDEKDEEDEEDAGGPTWWEQQTATVGAVVIGGTTCALSAQESDDAR